MPLLARTGYADRIRSSPPSPTLDYGRRSPPRIPRWFVVTARILGWTIVAAAGVGLVLLIGLETREQLRLRNCLHYAAPGHVVYDDHPDSARTLLAGSGYRPTDSWIAITRTFAVAHNSTFERFHATPNPPPVCFLHQRTAPGTSPRLVWVAFDVREFQGFKFVKMPCAREGSGIQLFQRPPHRLNHFQLCLAASDHVRIYDGAIDPADDSRFTIDIDINERRYTVDGQLDPSEGVLLTPRQGLFAQYGTRVWIPPGMDVPPFLGREAFQDLRTTTQPTPSPALFQPQRGSATRAGTLGVPSTPTTQ